MKKKPKKFIQKAIERPGALTAKAKAAGKSIKDYCAQADLSTQTKRQCNFALNVLAKVRKKKSK